MRKLLYIAAGSLLLPALTALTSSCGSSAKNTPSPEEEWTLVWEEDFADDTVNEAVWTRIPRGTADWNNMMSSYDSLYAVRDGNLILRGIVNDGKQTSDTAPYLTGGVYTLGKKAFQRGRLEIRARLDEARGAWPAFWLLPDTVGFPPADVAWPNGGEIDIMEHLSHDSVAYQTIHTYYTLKLGLDTVPPHFSTGPIHQGDYNVYAVELGSDSLRFFINDYNTFNYPRLDLDSAMGQYPFDRPMYLLVDMQLGGSWVGEVDPAELPVEMAVDWIRFYKRTTEEE